MEIENISRCLSKFMVYGTRYFRFPEEIGGEERMIKKKIEHNT